MYNLQVLLGFWWFYGMLVTISYKSSLIAHLSVPAVAKTLDTLEEAVDTPGWTIGYQPTYGAGWQWLIKNQNPKIKRASEMIEVSCLLKKKSMNMRQFHYSR